MPDLKALQRTSIPVSGIETWVEKDAVVTVTAADLAVITARDYIGTYVVALDGVVKNPKKEKAG